MRFAQPSYLKSNDMHLKIKFTGYKIVAINVIIFSVVPMSVSSVTVSKNKHRGAIMHTPADDVFKV